MPVTPVDPSHLQTWVEALNKELKRYSDKDWNYSRIVVEMHPLTHLTSPYILDIEWLALDGKQAQTTLKTLQGELTWGGRHSHELGILEIISLRLNKALLEVTSDAHWNGVRPIFRLAKCQDLLALGRTHGLWYRVDEVAGEEFENR